MKVFTSRAGGEDRIRVQVRAEGIDRIGDLIQDLLPGDWFLGRPYEWWASLPAGEHEIA